MDSLALLVWPLLAGAAHPLGPGDAAQLSRQSSQAALYYSSAGALSELVMVASLLPMAEV